jgi:hypothetical protein
MEIAQKKIFIIFLILTFGLIGLVSFFSKTETEKDQTESMSSLMSQKEEKSIKTRIPAVAGAFYPADKLELSNQVEEFLEKAEKQTIESQPLVLIVPHAGYDYSGQVAAAGYKILEEREIKRVILIGASHHSFVQGLVIDSNDSWQTPLGKTEIDIDLRDKIVKASSLFSINSLPHQEEHSLEVEIPFLQKVLTDFKILPILVNDLNDEDLEEASQILAENIDEKTILIVSSDMSHYPSYQDANRADKKVIEAILTGQRDNLIKTIRELEKENIPNTSTFLCAQKAVEIGMKVAEKLEAGQVQLLQYANSGDVEIGDRSRVVGYSAIVFSGKANRELNQNEKKELLAIARQSVETYIRTGQIPKFHSNLFYLNQKTGAFVTLKRQGQLRGCIGTFETDIPLYQVVSKMAVAAASQDFRFTPVQEEELDKLEYEISILSPLQKIDDWRKIEVGRHGVQVKKGTKSGIFLPQVAVENNWSKEEFLQNLCLNKAGLPKNCYLDPETELYVFTAQVFGEGGKEK